jgi:7-cyano-7-deazaguanine synthase in queuosine biosynthesis
LTLVAFISNIVSSLIFKIVADTLVVLMLYEAFLSNETEPEKYPDCLGASLNECSTLIRIAKMNNPMYKKMIGLRNNEIKPPLIGLVKTERQNVNLLVLDLLICI